MTQIQQNDATTAMTQYQQLLQCQHRSSMLQAQHPKHRNTLLVSQHRAGGYIATAASEQCLPGSQHRSVCWIRSIQTIERLMLQI